MDKGQLKTIYDTLREALPKPLNILSRAKKDAAEQQFICQATQVHSDRRYAIADHNGKLMGSFISPPVAKRYIQTVLRDSPIEMEEAIKRLCEQYKQARIIDAPSLMDLAATPALAVAGDLEVWDKVPGFQTVAEYKASRPKRKASKGEAEEEPGEAPKRKEEAAPAEQPKKKRAKKVKPATLQVPKFQSAIMRASKNADKALVMSRPAGEEGAEPIELSASAVNKKRATLFKHLAFRREVVDGALLEYVALTDGAKANPWYPLAQGDVLVSSGSRAIRFVLAGAAPADEAAPAEDEKE